MDNGTRLTIVRHFDDTPARLTTKLTTTGHCGGSPTHGAFAQLTLECQDFCMSVQYTAKPSAARRSKAEWNRLLKGLPEPEASPTSEPETPTSQAPGASAPAPGASSPAPGASPEIPPEPAPFACAVQASTVNLVAYGDHEIETLIHALETAAHDLRALRDVSDLPPRPCDARGAPCKTR